MLTHRAGENQQIGFNPTRWTLIARAGNGEDVVARHALAELYRIYSYPLYAFVRRRGVGPDQAADRIQAFFVELLDGHCCAVRIRRKDDSVLIYSVR